MSRRKQPKPSRCNALKNSPVRLDAMTERDASTAAPSQKRARNDAKIKTKSEPLDVTADSMQIESNEISKKDFETIDNDKLEAKDAADSLIFDRVISTTQLRSLQTSNNQISDITKTDVKSKKAGNSAKNLSSVHNSDKWAPKCHLTCKNNYFGETNSIDEETQKTYDTATVNACALTRLKEQVRRLSERFCVGFSQPHAVLSLSALSHWRDATSSFPRPPTATTQCCERRKMSKQVTHASLKNRNNGKNDNNEATINKDNNYNDNNTDKNNNNGNVSKDITVNNYNNNNNNNESAQACDTRKISVPVASCDTRNVLSALSRFVERVGADSGAPTVPRQREASRSHISASPNSGTANDNVLRCIVCGKQCGSLDALAQHKRHTGHFRNDFAMLSKSSASSGPRPKTLDEKFAPAVGDIMTRSTTTALLYLEQLRDALHAARKIADVAALSPLFAGGDDNRQHTITSVVGAQSVANAIGRRGHFGFRCNLCGYTSMSAPVDAHMTSAHSFRNAAEWKEAIVLIPVHK